MTEITHHRRLPGVLYRPESQPQLIGNTGWKAVGTKRGRKRQTALFTENKLLITEHKKQVATENKQKTIAPCEI